MLIKLVSIRFHTCLFFHSECSVFFLIYIEKRLAMELICRIIQDIRNHENLSTAETLTRDQSLPSSKIQK